MHTAVPPGLASARHNVRMRTRIAAYTVFTYAYTVLHGLLSTRFSRAAFMYVCVFNDICFVARIVALWVTPYAL